MPNIPEWLKNLLAIVGSIVAALTFIYNFTGKKRRLELRKLEAETELKELELIKLKHELSEQNILTLERKTK